MRGFSTPAACLAACVACLITTSSASAQPDRRAATGRSPFSLAAGLGFTADPGTFLLSIEAPLEIAPDLSMVPMLQLGVEDNLTIVSPSWNLRYSLALTDFVTTRDASLRRIRPYVQAGLGATHIDRDRGGRDIDDTGFLVTGGFGAEYRFDDAYSATTGMLFNFLPGEVLGERFYFSWQMIGFRRHF